MGSKPFSIHMVRSYSVEFYVQRFPEGGGRQQISAEGGVQPRWRGDGNELFYWQSNTLLPARTSLRRCRRWGKVRTGRARRAAGTRRPSTWSRTGTKHSATASRTKSL